ncbi:uncharacterized protein LOC141537532 [Cotesia typhae]|uniref:uncharacterized protein LOC141537532 n=1 Tax=Cotesia typhae TaxID=2053667 RepID=UPI003D691C47
MDYVVDFIGYNIITGKTQKVIFIIKEFCIVRVTGNKVYQPVHHIVKQPFSWRKLSPYFQTQYTELLHNIHGLDWTDGDVSVKEARQIISHKFKKAPSIYVLKEVQIRDFKRFTRTNYSMTSLDQFGFKLPESVVTLKTWSKNTMSHHVVKTAMFTAHLLSRAKLPLTKSSLRRHMQKMHLTENDIERINKQITKFLKNSLSVSMIECKIINLPDGRVRVEMKSYVNSTFRYKNWVDMDNNENYEDMHFKIVRNKFSISKAYLISKDATGTKYELVSNEEFLKLWEIVELLKIKIDDERKNQEKFANVSDASSELDKVEGINPGRISPIDNSDDDWAASGSNHWMETEEDANYESDSTVDEFRQTKESYSGREGPDVDSEIDINYNGWTSIDDIKMEPGTSRWSPNLNRSPKAHKSPKFERSSDFDNVYQHKKFRKSFDRSKNPMRSPNNREIVENNQVNPNVIEVGSDSDVDQIYEHKKLQGSLSRSQNLNSDSIGREIRSSPRLDLNRASGNPGSINRRDSLLELDQLEIIHPRNNTLPVRRKNNDSEKIKFKLDHHGFYDKSDPIRLIWDDNSSEGDVIVDDDYPRPMSKRSMNDNSDDEDWAISYKDKR